MHRNLTFFPKPFEWGKIFSKENGRFQLQKMVLSLYFLSKKEAA